MKAAFLDFASLGPDDLDVTALTTLLPGIGLFPVTATGELPGRIADCEILLVNKVQLDRALLARAPRLRLIGLAATGTDNVDLAAARERGIAVCNIRDYCTPSVVQHVFGLLLALTLRLPEYRDLVASGAWSRSDQFCLLDFPVRELAGKTLGIVGLGTLGRAVAGVARAFGMTIIAAGRAGGPGREQGGGSSVAEPGVERVPLAGLLRRAHVISLHCPLTPATRHLIDGTALEAMGRDAILINTARGGLVDPGALVNALRAGRIAGAGIDVLAEEPPAAGDPLLDARLPNLIVTPHVAWAARESRQRALDELVGNVRDFLAGGRRNRVDQTGGQREFDDSRNIR